MFSFTTIHQVLLPRSFAKRHSLVFQMISSLIFLSIKTIYLAFYIFNKIPGIFNICIYFFTVPCRAPSFHRSILNNEIHLSGSRLYGMVLVYGMAKFCLYNEQNNTWTLRDMEFIFSCSHLISHSFAALTRSI